MKNFAKQLLKRAFHSLGYDISRYHLLSDIEDEQRRLIARMRPYTLTSVERMVALSDGIRYVVANDIPGSIVECGVWRGGSTMLAAATLLSLGVSNRDVYLYDTFEGMSEPTNRDISYEGKSAKVLLDADPDKTGVGVRVGLEEVKKNVAQIGYPADRMHFVQGKVEDTIPERMPKGIALLRLDTDWYESTRHELEHLYPLLSPGGVLIVDDYGHWQGARQAVDEYFQRQEKRPYMHRIDYTGRLMIKPAP